MRKVNRTFILMVTAVAALILGGCTASQQRSRQPNRKPHVKTTPAAPSHLPVTTPIIIKDGSPVVVAAYPNPIYAYKNWGKGADAKHLKHPYQGRHVGEIRLEYPASYSGGKPVWHDPTTDCADGKCWEYECGDSPDYGCDIQIDYRKNGSTGFVLLRTQAHLKAVEVSSSDNLDGPDGPDGYTLMRVERTNHDLRRRYTGDLLRAMPDLRLCGPIAGPRCGGDAA